MCVSKEKGRDDLLCTVTTLGVVTVRWRCVVGVVGRASWMMVVVEKERCGLLMAPKSMDIRFGRDQPTARLREGSVLTYNSRMVQQLERTFAHARDTLWSRSFNS